MILLILDSTGNIIVRPSFLRMHLLFQLKISDANLNCVELLSLKLIIRSYGWNFVIRLMIRFNVKI